MKADDQRPADAQRGSTQVARRSQQQTGERGFIGSFLVEVDVDDATPFGGEDPIHSPGQLECLLVSQRGLLRVDFISCLDARLGQVLLRFGTSLTARTVIRPIDFGSQSFPLAS